MTTRVVATCPVCNGVGQVKASLYDRLNRYAKLLGFCPPGEFPPGSTLETNLKMCPNCGGWGLIYLEQKLPEETQKGEVK